MREEKIFEEKLKLLEQEISTIADSLGERSRFKTEIDDLKTEFKALKVFLGRHYPEFKKDYAEILKKLQKD